MRNEDSDYPFLEASDLGALKEWSLVASYNDKREGYSDETVFLLQNKQDPCTGLLIDDHHAGTALSVNVRVKKELVRVTALCVCDSCFRGQEIADRLAGIAKSAGITVVITRHCYKSGGVYFHQRTDKLPQTIK